MEQEVLNKEIVEFFLEKNILIGSDAQKTVLNLTKEQKTLLFENIKKKISDEELFVLDKQTISRLINKAEKVKENAQEKNHTGPKVNVVFSYDEKSVKRDITHFVAYFRQRFKAFEQMMQGRQEIIGRVSVSRAKNKREKENVSIIGMVRDKALTRNKHLMITVEDLTGTIKILVNKNRDDLFKIANDIVFDEVIGIEGNVSKDLIFANKIIMPDIPLTKELKKSPLEEYAAFLGDPHFGSNKFLKKEFDRLINWLNGRGGDERQKAMASKIKYLFIVGDLVDGVGIYPDQEEDLEFPDIYEQYREFTEFLIQIPKDIKIIVSPGNHDAMRISEPQPPLSEEFSKEVHGLPNVVFVSNPSVVNIGYFEGFEGFEGFDVLIYHGYSFPYYADTIESIRSKGGLERADLIMQLLLKKRHLSPSHTASLYIPDSQKDPLIIEKIPDFFISGHIHRTTAKNYKNITLLNCSCWIGQTAYQEKVGLKPQPARLPIINLKTREIKILKFGKDVYTLNDE